MACSKSRCDTPVVVGRHVDERLALRLPWLVRRLNKLALAAIPRGSAVRGRVAKQLLARVFEALAREGYETVMLTYDPDVEITIVGDEARAVRVAERYRGHQGTAI